ncbi:hypothetical protein Dform_00485 [Dehalogenimonas formicexedens]|uniref:site-specific DNA-methyltransferase (adenine-specific) n=2 Tax=Dehalogenimonas TaxID=670486 RepID=A0A1P8F5Y0_9CHLR|nr:MULTISPECIES: type ISP restriction/modification enzyme [Dehalogenimonas]APV43840.1 hypothetical protein Dform_00485 [Dehalogenimonas formicexedens]KTB49309.1 hypothetical protein DEALK_02220 [Dehalogenimonas alkenigignens]
MPASEMVNSHLITFAAGVREKFASPLGGQPEDQLKNPVENLIRSLAFVLGHELNVVTEATAVDIGRPDMAVAVGGALTGHIELKKPGTGVDPTRFTGHNAQQWGKFKELPNLIYTDGNAWALYRNGQRIGEMVDIGDIDQRGSRGLRLETTPAFFTVIREFLSWEPITPASPCALAEQLAPLCRLLRDDVLQAVTNTESALAQLAYEWRTTLFPDATDEAFADAYAQTLTYALLLARFDGASDLRPARAAETLSHKHKLLGHVLTLLADPQTRLEIGTGVDILVRVIEAVDPTRLIARDPDPWLYFYEDFLAAYDPKMREERGVYYTPVQVVHCQVRLVEQLLIQRFGKPMTYADDDVVLLDPAAGTGTYPLAAITEALERVLNRYGVGAVPPRATKLAKNVHAFELLVGPYAVAHLRVTQKLQEAGATLPADGVHVYLTDTLESPDVAPPGRLPLALRPLVDEHRRAAKVKKETRVLVCIGNPPYERQAFDASEGTDDPLARRERLLGDFINLAVGRTRFSHIASLYNTYVYFWRWALWKVFESPECPGNGIVSYITASSYLNGPGFIGMREVMRRVFDELWIIDLEGGSLGARRTENVFAIQTPVAIAIGVRYGIPNPETPAAVHYAKITGSRDEKLAELDSISSFNDLNWQECSNEWTAPLIPTGRSPFSTWPLLIDLFPWQQPGVKVGRTWPIAVTRDVAEERWHSLASSPPSARGELFADRRFGRGTTTRPSSGMYPPPASPQPILEVTTRSPMPPIVRYAHRSFERKWLLADGRLFRTPSQPLWVSHSEKQIYLVSLLTGVLGTGPATVVAAQVPDLHHFRGSFGGKDVIPLWRDSAGTEANVTNGLLAHLAQVYGAPVSPEELFAYCHATLAGPSYTGSFAEELATSSPRIPITADANLFRRGVELGGRLIWLQTYGERFVPTGQRSSTIPAGRARAVHPVPVIAEGYPRDFHWDEVGETLHVGEGSFTPVSKKVWEFEVSGLRPVKSWLGYRMFEPAGRTSSPLDKIRPCEWPAEFTEELLELLWVLEHTVNMSSDLAEFLEAVIQGGVFLAADLPQPNASQREAPEIPNTRVQVRSTQMPLVEG